MFILRRVFAHQKIATCCAFAHRGREKLNETHLTCSRLEQIAHDYLFKSGGWKATVWYLEHLPPRQSVVFTSLYYPTPKRTHAVFNSPCRMTAIPRNRRAHQFWTQTRVSVPNGTLFHSVSLLSIFSDIQKY